MALDELRAVLLEVLDVVSLYFGLVDVETGVSGAREGVPTLAGADPVRIAIEPVVPWRVLPSACRGTRSR